MDSVHTRGRRLEQLEAVVFASPASHATRPVPLPRAQGAGRQQPHRLGHQPRPDMDGRSDAAAGRAPESGATRPAGSGLGDGGRRRRTTAASGPPLAGKRAQGQAGRPAGAVQAVSPVPRGRGRRQQDGVPIVGGVHVFGQRLGLQPVRPRAVGPATAVQAATVSQEGAQASRCGRRE